VGASWSLTETGDTFNGVWTLSTTSALDRTVIDAGAGGSVFDTILDPTLSPASDRGTPFEFSGPAVAGVTARYFDEVALPGFNPFGDLFRRLEVSFATAYLGNMGFVSDTDSVTFGSVILPIPLPTAAALFLPAV